MENLILAVDRAFQADKWIDAQAAMNLISRGVVQTSFGDTALVLRGGTNAITGKQSVMEVGSILVVDTKQYLVSDFAYAPYERELLFKRDRCICAYCVQEFKPTQLTVEHVRPQCQGGETVWTNLVSACKACNQKKGGRTPEQARMELAYLPYSPGRYEWLIMKNRRILGDQMDFLMQRVPKHSRLRS
ncbi:HNH endonuclease [Paraburkholderia sp. UCT31]|uniref:HNH endonuclease n=1 Tax=Paraburkholderia sp. UCT31 TaxID=2615209 RepID=UPI001655975A|nr:HNH endonuclease [Paraburkholderia sp. UCT31]MBC8740424.1 HNH endonuclease [Paraburkholderia sp. UCT31]